MKRFNSTSCHWLRSSGTHRLHSCCQHTPGGQVPPLSGTPRLLTVCEPSHVPVLASSFCSFSNHSWLITSDTYWTLTKFARYCPQHFKGMNLFPPKTTPWNRIHRHLQSDSKTEWGHQTPFLTMGVKTEWHGESWGQGSHLYTMCKLERKLASRGGQEAHRTARNEKLCNPERLWIHSPPGSQRSFQKHKPEQKLCVNFYNKFPSHL